MTVLAKSKGNVFKELEAELQPELVVSLEIFFDVRILWLLRERRSLR